jgi:hypothetical protein
MSSFQRLKNKRFFSFLLALGLFGGIFLLARQEFSDLEDPGCLMEAKLCPDGTYVGRTGKDCQFDPCPAETASSSSSEFDNEQIEAALTEYLLAQPRFRGQTSAGSRSFCALENLDPENELFPFSLWVRCGEFTLQGSELQERSGVSLPVKINYPNELSFYDPQRFSYQAPGDGAAYSEDLKKLFSPKVQERISRHDDSALTQKLKSQALAWIEARHAAWKNLREALAACQVQEVSQTHDRSVTATLKNGVKLEATEPQLDDVLGLVRESEATCGPVPVATE